jgi:peptidoglycan/LPS O-acetylase OafA/YrhL
MPRLDGLRALAVGGVLLDHYVHAPFIHMLGPGGAGVRLFFVLSGFLITSILLMERDRSTGVGDAAVRFYGRRLLRLSPPLWIAIAWGAAFGILNIRHDWWKHALYLTNIMVSRHHNWTGPAHFWSLSVEEQFYLAWFFVVVVAPRRWLVPVILACIAIAPTYRAMIPQPEADHPVVLLPGQVDALALGALLACARQSANGAAVTRFFENRALLAVFLAIALMTSEALGWPHRLSGALWPLAVAFASACAISLAAQPFAPGRGGPLDWPIVRHFGRISYGLYVYHYFVPWTLALAWPVFADPHGPAQKLSTATISVLITVAVAEVSWRFVEKPILGLKDRLDALDRRAIKPATASAPPQVAPERQLPAAAADSSPS